MIDNIPCVVLTGQPEGMDRLEFAAMLESAGFLLSGSISKKTSYLLVGDDASVLKIEKAHTLGIPVISIDEFAEIAHLPYR